ncbi:DUF2199 domain-containing protein [Shimazuella kribbensis]|uniref:DUF2199 domain-containing protein n=1 Tax=Shimazuella kribbensis TaxID=139808 RepID=UPI000566FDE8|nr:DUF2199 domain-containing protein [Shimazuella kribbensis]
MNNIKGYICSCCGKYHDKLPMSYGNQAPYHWYQISLEEKETRCEINSDICVIDDRYFFIRGCIEIPVAGMLEPFIWDVWVSLNESNIKKTIEVWDIKGREEKVKPMFGWLSTSIPCYPETLNLKTMVHMRRVGVRPFIELEPTEHPLSVEQRKGITMDRIKQIAEQFCSESRSF